jgi:hypothetical protein
MQAARQANDWLTYFTLYLSQHQQEKGHDLSDLPTSNIVTIAKQLVTRYCIEMQHVSCWTIDVISHLCREVKMMMNLVHSLSHA